MGVLAGRDGVVRHKLLSQEVGCPSLFALAGALDRSLLSHFLIFKVGLVGLEGENKGPELTHTLHFGFLET